MSGRPLTVIQNLDRWHQWRASHDSATIGLVLTMGALHKGHAALLERSVAENDRTILTLFVNPTQFNHPGDLKNYPSTWDQDIAMARDLDVDVVLSPTYQSVYPYDYRFKVVEREIGVPMEGEFRPGHFDGVLTVVLKFLLLTRPHRAYFGMKDYQQYMLARDMAQAFFLPTEIVGCSTIREPDGLACSSRNLRLDPQQRALAPKFYERLSQEATCVEIANLLRKDGFEVEYVEEVPGRRLAAVRLGDVRLIDNVDL